MLATNGSPGFSLAMTAPILLALVFFFTAMIYASVGFGGGSTYNAVLILAGIPIAAVPQIALLCNVAVVAIGSWRFARSGHVRWARLWPLLLLSVPAAWLGGYLQVPAWLFVGLLAIALIVASLAMLWQPTGRDPRPDVVPSAGVDTLVGGGLGLIAGITGIGGGIYLSPVLHLRCWGPAKEIAGVCALFILVNSIAGLAGQVAKSGLAASINSLSDYWLLFPAVAFGGYIGSTLGAAWLKERHLRIVTAILIFYVGVRLGFRFPHEWASA